MRRENFYLLLELDESVDDWPAIESRILDKKRQWAKDRTNGSPKAQRHAQRCLPLIPEIEAVLRDAEARREEAREARKLRQKERQEKLRELDEQIEMILHGDGACDEPLLKKLERSFQGTLTGQEIRKRLQTAGVQMGSGRPETAERPRRETLEKVTAQTVRKNLDHLGLSSLYELLELSPSSSPRALADRADEIYRENQRLGRTDADASAKNELAGLCKKLFQDEKNKALYDNYLAIQAMESLKESLEIAGNDGFITRQEMAGLIKQARKRRVEAEDARAYIEDYAHRRKWKIQRDDDEAKVEDLRLCGFCSALASPGARQCGECGEPLEMECPSCGALTATQNAACETCGFHTGDAPLVRGLVKEGERLAAEGEIAGALRAFDKALVYWPDHAPAVAAKQRLEQRKKDYEAELLSLEELLRERRLSAAQSALERFERQHGKGPETLWQRVQSGLGEAEAAFHKGEKLRQSGRRDEALDAYEEALAACADFAPAYDAVAASPPPAPPRLTVEALAGGFRLRWPAASGARRLSYRVLRKAQGAPQSAEDGQRLNEVAATSLDDVDVAVGSVSYYAVFSLRGGVPSATAATSGPHLRTAEVEDLRAVAGNREVTLRFKVPPGCRRVGVWRRRETAPATGDGSVVTVAGDSAQDSGLQNGTRYGYRVVAFFADPQRPGEEVASAGEVVFATPVAPPKPVTDLRAERHGRTVTLRWTPPSEANVQLRHATRAPACAPGNVFAVEDLDRFGEPVTSTSAGSAQMTLKDQGRIFFVPFSVAASTAVAGEPLEITQVDPVTDLVSRRASAGIFLSWTWPAGLDEAVVCYAHDRYPDQASQGTQLVVSRREYERQDGLHLRRVERAPHYFSVFARAGELYAAPARTCESMGKALAVSYQVVVKKALLRRSVEDAWLELACQGAQNGFTLPAVVVVGKARQVPLSPRDGETLTEVAALCFENGRSRIPIPSQHYRKNLYLKLFFKDAAQAQELRLLPAEKERLRLG